MGMEVSVAGRKSDKENYSNAIKISTENQHLSQVA